MLNNLKIGPRLNLGFLSILLLFSLFAFFTINRMGLLSSQTVMMYRHPLTVSNAVLRINTNMIKIHRSIKEMVLAGDAADIEQTTQYVAELEQKVLADFTIIDERFLGEKNNVVAARRVFAEWKPIRDEVTALMRMGQTAEAARITQREGADHFRTMERSMETLGTFAQRKAAEFLYRTETVRRTAFTTVYIVIAVAVLASLALSFFLTRSITGPLKLVKDAAERLGAGDLDAVATADHPDEIGQLAASFNQMSVDLKSVTASRDELNREIEERRKAQERTKATLLEKESLVAELDRKNEALFLMNRNKSEFLRSMGHELRTPITSVLTLSGLLLTGLDGHLSQEQEKQIRMIRESTEHLQHLVDDLLDLSRIEAGVIALSVTEFAFDDLYSAASASILPLAQEKGLTMDCEADPDLPLLRTDFRLSLQVLLNLLSNAVKFTDEGGIHVTAKADGTGDPGRISITVMDTGMGIPEGEGEVIFQEFKQLHSREDVKRGVGLGLTITKKLLEQLGGDIRVRSRLRHGSEFCFSLPAAPAGEKRHWDGDKEVTSWTLDGLLATLKARNRARALRKILVIDDEQAETEVFKRNVTGGHEILTARDGRGGLEILRKESPDLVILDLIMPGMDGFEFLRQCKSDKNGRGTPIIVRSSKELSQEEKSTLKGDVLGVVDKREWGAAQLLDRLGNAFKGTDHRSD